MPAVAPQERGVCLRQAHMLLYACENAELDGYRRERHLAAAWTITRADNEAIAQKRDARAPNGTHAGRSPRVNRSAQAGIPSG